MKKKESYNNIINGLRTRKVQKHFSDLTKAERGGMAHKFRPS
jgi:hypothetical protein